MRPIALVCSLALLTMFSTALEIHAEETAPAPMSAEHQIASAVLAAPEELREGATVLGYDAEGEMVTLQEGEGPLVCLADAPGDDRFHVACYFKELDPFMARGRELKKEGKSRDEIQSTRLAEIEAGDLPLPTTPTALYNLSGDGFDAAKGEVEGASPFYVVYTPYATEASTGLSAKPRRDGTPWLMGAGKPWAHIMVIPPPKPEPAEEVASDDGEGS